jgi:hypothetical protein
MLKGNHQECVLHANHLVLPVLDNLHFALLVLEAIQLKDQAAFHKRYAKLTLSLFQDFM